jgi:hypothetical protein
MQSGWSARNGYGRRWFLAATASVSGLALAGCAAAPRTSAERSESEADADEAEVTPGEDLMQEHGVLERILLVYDESARRLERGDALDLSVVVNAARIASGLVESYHEKLEEEFVFPRLEAARRETELVSVLRRQHERGRELTKEIERLASSAGATSDLAKALRGFERMYAPSSAAPSTASSASSSRSASTSCSASTASKAPSPRSRASSPRCTSTTSRCSRLDRGGGRAFGVIPYAIGRGANPHTDRYPGDGGLRFEPRAFGGLG